jgi:two-component system nitrogen regulation response regulator GlnG
VRELENVIQRALVVCKADAIMIADLPPEIVATRPDSTQIALGEHVTTLVPATSGVDDVAGLAAALFNWARLKPSAKVLPAVERELVICALEETNGNQVQAAKLLGITRATLRKRIEKFGIQRELSIR